MMLSNRLQCRKTSGELKLLVETEKPDEWRLTLHYNMLPTTIHCSRKSTIMAKKDNTKPLKASYLKVQCQYTRTCINA